VEVDARKKKAKELTEGELCLWVVELMGMLVGEAEEINQGLAVRATAGSEAEVSRNTNIAGVATNSKS